MKTDAKGERKNEKEASCGDLECSSWYDHDTGYLYGLSLIHIWHVLIWGRIQSREYMKRISENETEKRIAYEVSVSKLEYVE